MTDDGKDRATQDEHNHGEPQSQRAMEAALASAPRLAGPRLAGLSPAVLSPAGPGLAAQLAAAVADGFTRRRTELELAR